jgi:YD repeat-containing protein
MDATTPAPADSQVDQYTTTPFDARVYDAKGNLTSVDAGMPSQRLLAWDYRNRLVEVQDSATGQRHTYAYDALGRRIEKVVDADGTPMTTRYYYRGARVIEERNGAGTTTATYVRSLDGRPRAGAAGLVLEPDDRTSLVDLQMRRGGTDAYYHHDDVGSVVAVSGAMGAVLERYDYDDFGTPAVLEPDHDPLAGTAIGNPYLFRGMRLDAETGFLLRDGSARILDSRAGRWLDASAGASGAPGCVGSRGGGVLGISLSGPWDLGGGYRVSIPGGPTVAADDVSMDLASAPGYRESIPGPEVGFFGPGSQPFEGVAFGAPARSPGTTGWMNGPGDEVAPSGEGRTAYASGDPWSGTTSASVLAGRTGFQAIPPIFIGSSGLDGVRRSGGLSPPVSRDIGSSGQDGVRAPRVEPTDWDDHLYIHADAAWHRRRELAPVPTGGQAGPAALRRMRGASSGLQGNQTAAHFRTELLPFESGAVVGRITPDFSPLGATTSSLSAGDAAGRKATRKTAFETLEDVFGLSSDGSLGRKAGRKTVWAESFFDIHY